MRKTKCLVLDALGGGEYRQQECEGEVRYGYCAKHIRFYWREVDKLSAEEAASAERRDKQLKFGQRLLDRPRRR